MSCSTTCSTDSNIPNSVLYEMAWTVPTTQDELVTLDRITPQFASKYGNVFLQLIQLFLDTNGITLQTPFVSRGLLRRKQQEAFRREYGGKNRLEEASRQVMQGIGKENKDANDVKDINHEDNVLDEDWYGNDDSSRSFHILSCIQLESIEIGRYSFRNYGGEFELVNLPKLSSIKIGEVGSDSHNFHSSSFVVKGIIDMILLMNRPS